MSRAIRWSWFVTNGKIRGHHNVCRHKGAIVAAEEDDSQHRCDFFQCPYHGWEYHLDGRLKKTPMLGHQQQFSAEEQGLTPVSVDTWGPFVFVDLDGPLEGVNNPRDLHADLEPIKSPLEDLGFSALKFYRRFTYDMNCNWKVFVDNSLDGGYHVKYAHEGLAGGLDMDEFETHIHDRTSLQICHTKGADARLGSKVMYAYLFPNFFINRYGRMMDTNVVMPSAVDKCRVIFDFYFDYDDPESWEARKHMRKGVASSHTIQEEDIEICESAQRGMNSMASHTGRYSSVLEKAAHAFHVLLWRELRGVEETVGSRQSRGGSGTKYSGTYRRLTVGSASLIILGSILRGLIQGKPCMKIHEFQAKELLREAGVAVPRGIVARTPEEAAGAYRELGGTVAVVKAQIHAGGRGKGTVAEHPDQHGVQLVRSAEEAAPSLRICWEITSSRFRRARKGKPSNRFSSKRAATSHGSCIWASCSIEPGHAGADGFAGRWRRDRKSRRRNTRKDLQRTF